MEMCIIGYPGRIIGCDLRWLKMYYALLPHYTHYKAIQKQARNDGDWKLEIARWDTMKEKLRKTWVNQKGFTVAERS